ncbi:hypothetical protein V6N13_005123 [Hibiscus sabdariffa]|uniref:Uncharacterized protein n=1 Tax=Hibiscus sabdariffa TaxID=183260 RepID=A0ABR2C3H3_9ROSI
MRLKSQGIIAVGREVWEATRVARLRLIPFDHGKMKPQKTKQLSVAIAEASSAGEDAFAKQQAQTNPRKRGRPRKIVEKTESEEQKEGIDS